MPMFDPQKQSLEEWAEETAKAVCDGMRAEYPCIDKCLEDIKKTLMASFDPNSGPS